MTKLERRYLYFCWWLDRLVRSITPTHRHVCAIHGGKAIRTFKAGKACIYCYKDD